MRVNPSLTARLRIGFGVLFALLLAVSLLGVGRLFQIRVNYENDITRFFQLELESERLRSAFILEQAAARPATPQQKPSQAELDRATRSFNDAVSRARESTESDPVLNVRLDQLIHSEGAWRRAVGEPLVHGHVPPPGIETRRTSAVTRSGEALSSATRSARVDAQDDARSDTRDTTVLVAAGLIGGLLAALILFTGLINSMRAPLGRLVEGARRLAGGDLRTRVEVGGPVEIATLGNAFNEMANSLERDARERDRVERMKDDFVLTVSHELRTPVTVVKGFAEMLTEQRKSLNTRQYEAAEVIAESAAQLQKMINDLLDLARSDAGKLRIEPQPMSVNELAQRVGRQMKPHFDERHQSFTVSVETGVPDVQADPDRISQVLANLLTNANKYAPEESEVTLAATRTGDEVEFAVSDNGPGLGEEELDHVFDRFWRAESGETQSVGGTGLGLAIAKSLVELHGGAITVDSTAGEGATFRFVLPIAKDGRATQSDSRSRMKAQAAG
ncbi:MAG TPA: HAMP domain-containing sensor histidine kinase [Solirubrobacterales bacterium]|nr:HAMP domain-containing sensor histidine kinase [Solirubrobacterales bacterium]